MKLQIQLKFYKNFQIKPTIRFRTQSNFSSAQIFKLYLSKILILSVISCLLSIHIKVFNRFMFFFIFAFAEYAVATKKYGTL